ncbi:MAG TPA: permease prefix domain 1-containing protein [Jiangellales bacterium]|nr:permease prefix domain 1-containing protein [Jiangellales bacterium]
MTAVHESPDADLEAQIGQWRGYVLRHRAISGSDVEELEDHLRDQIGDLGRSGLSGDEAFLVAVRRLGGLDAVSREFAREHSDRLWKQLVLAAGPGEAATSGGGRRELGVVLGLAVGAAAAVKLPALVGLTFDDDPGFYARNLSLFVLPLLAAYFAWKRAMPTRQAMLLLVPPFAVAAVLANVYPFATGGATEVLTAIHLPVVLWLAMGLAYVGGQWRSQARRMDFIRFTGEWAVYYTLIALGGGLLVGITIAGFSLLGIDAAQFLGTWVLPCGAMGAVLVAAWLVEAKQSVVENIAPVLTKVFTPLTTLMLLALLAATLAGGDVVQVERELLILVDLILVLVLGLLLYAISARDPDAPPGAFDWLQLVLVGSALAVDVLMLSAMLGRIAEFGFSANKTAALGLNLVLLVNLAWSAWLSVGFLRQRVPLRALEWWQTGYLPVYATWAAVVVVAFPPVFDFV